MCKVPYAHTANLVSEGSEKEVKACIMCVFVCQRKIVALSISILSLYSHSLSLSLSLCRVDDTITLNDQSWYGDSSFSLLAYANGT